MNTFSRTILYANSDKFHADGFFGRIFVKPTVSQDEVKAILRAQNPTHYDLHFRDELVAEYNHHGTNLLVRNQRFQFNVAAFADACTKADLSVLIFSCTSLRETTLEEQYPHTR